MSSLRTLYARAVLWLIRPALEAWCAKNQIDPQVVIDSMIRDLHRNGPYTRASRGCR